MEISPESLGLLIKVIVIFGSVISVLLAGIIGLGKYIWNRFVKGWEKAQEKIDKRFEKLEEAIKEGKTETKNELKEYRSLHEREHKEIWKAIDECCPRGK